MQFERAESGQPGPQAEQDLGDCQQRVAKAEQQGQRPKTAPQQLLRQPGLKADAEVGAGQAAQPHAHAQPPVGGDVAAPAEEARDAADPDQSPRVADRAGDVWRPALLFAIVLVILTRVSVRPDGSDQVPHRQELRAVRV